METIFSKIIKGEIPSSKVYEDEDFIAILDIMPTNLGHVLLIPKEYFENIFDAPESVGSKVYPLLSKLAKAMKEALNCDGINIVQNNGKAAGQEVFHAHIHLIPRYENDGIRFTPQHKEYDSTEHMQQTAEKIKSSI
ncbi:HIT domain-containing protein [Limisalsivibrio acetivorans]|uniref:HIT domain-containing protein n=1 Tax=Limisalsivibrio acetivorans TaxID=1304888 RepID=UPI00040C57B6